MEDGSRQRSASHYSVSSNVLRTPGTESFENTAPTGAVSVRHKILAYLGQLKKDQWVSAAQIVRDLQLRFTTAKNTLRAVEEAGLVDRAVRLEGKNNLAFFQLSPSATSNGKPFVPPDWSDAYGKHPRNL